MRNRQGFSNLQPDKSASRSCGQKQLAFNGLNFAAGGIVRCAHAEKNRKIYASDTDRHPAGGAARPRAALRSGRSGFHPGQGGRLRLRGARHGPFGRPHPPRLPAPADGRRDAADRPGRYARRLRPALAGRGPVAADPERGRRPQFRTGPDRGPLQRHHGRFGYAPLRRTALARGDPGRPPDPEGRHRPDHTLRRRYLPRPEGIGPCGKDRQHGSAGLVARHPENLGPEHLLRDADRTRGDRTRGTPCRRHGRGVPRPARQPAGQRRERAARPRRLLLPDRLVRSRGRNAARTCRHDALPAMDRTGRKRRADRQPGGVRHAGPPPRRGIRPGVHRPFGPRPYDRLGLQPGLRHRPATSPDEIH